jgi:hypothetical protein
MACIVCVSWLCGAFSLAAVFAVRSFVLVGLSELKLIFDYQYENAWNRERGL